VTADELHGSGALDFNVYATLQTSTSDLPHDPAFDSGFHVDNDIPVADGPSSARPTPPPPSDYPTASAPADHESTVDGPLLTEAEAADSADPTWDNFSDLEFPRGALDVIDTLGNSSFGEVRLSAVKLHDDNRCFCCLLHFSFVSLYRVVQKNCTQSNAPSFCNRLQ